MDADEEIGQLDPGEGSDDHAGHGSSGPRDREQSAGAGQRDDAAAARARNARQAPSAMHTLRGRIVRAWRDEAGVTSRELGAATHLSDSQISRVLTGERGDMATVESIAREIGAEPLPRMWWAAGSMRALSAKALVYLNPEEQGRPVWIWLRVPAGRPLKVTCRWGRAMTGRIEEEVGPDGLILQLPTSVLNPPMEVWFDGGGGWADMGHGTVPGAVALRLGIPLRLPKDLDVSPSRLRGLHPQDEERQELNSTTWLGGSLVKPMVEWCARYATKMGLKWTLISPHVTSWWHPEVTGSLDGTHADTVSGAQAPSTDSGGLLTSQLTISPDDLRNCREARGFSRPQLVKDVNELDDHLPQLTVRQLELLETPPPSGSRARNRDTDRASLPFARIDRALRADGRLAVERVADSRGHAREQEIGSP